MSLSGAEGILGSLFSQTFGLPIVFGMMAIIAVVFFVVSLKLPIDAALVIIMPFVFILGQYGFLPAYFNIIVVLGLGVIIFMAIQKLVRR